jgi:hypothetical protein
VLDGAKILSEWRKEKFSVGYAGTAERTILPLPRIVQKDSTRGLGSLFRDKTRQWSRMSTVANAMECFATIAFIKWN